MSQWLALPASFISALNCDEVASNCMLSAYCAVPRKADIIPPNLSSTDRLNLFSHATKGLCMLCILCPCRWRGLVFDRHWKRKFVLWSEDVSISVWFQLGLNTAKKGLYSRFLSKFRTR